MRSDLSNLAREIAGWYVLTVASSVTVLVGAAGWKRKLNASTRVLRPSNSIWFLPVYVWALESVNRLLSILTGRDGSHGGHAFFVAACGSAFGAGALSLLACSSAEALAGYRGLPARPAGSLPLPILAGVAAVTVLWWGTFVVVIVPAL